MPRPLITLLTDFGTGSPYVAQMKGVILSLCREVDLVDISHEIKPQSIREGAMVLADAAPRFPAGTIHIAVVDPGVGTARRAIYAEIGTQRFVTPDNGLLTLLARREATSRIISLENQQFWLPQVSHTFHGRDLIAPVAAHLAAGTDPAELGSAREEIVLLDWPQPTLSGRRLTGEVLYVDSFGNLITNIGPAEVNGLGSAKSLTIEVGGKSIRGLVRTYGAALAGELVALFDSQGRLEVAIVEGNAGRDLKVKSGDPVTVAGK